MRYIWRGYFTNGLQEDEVIIQMEAPHAEAAENYVADKLGYWEDMGWRLTAERFEATDPNWVPIRLN